MRKFNYLFISVVIALVTVTACQNSSEELDELETIQQLELSESSELSAKGGKVDISHWDADAGEFVITSISVHAYDKHIAHGDKAVDIEGNEYKVVQIGSQIWMAENLRTTTYSNGTPIPNVTDNKDWSNLLTPAYSWYNNDQSGYGDTYGALYNWYTVGTGDLAPEGWHVATDEEWNLLIAFVGGEGVAGGKLKELGFEHWDDPNTGATNEYGFAALGAGYRSIDGSIVHLGKESLWWSSTAGGNPETAGTTWMGNDKGSVIRSHGSNRKYGYSVRCIKD